MAADSLTYGSRHMIVSGHPLATTAGLELLDEGGSVVDAAIGAAAVLAVVLPQACTLGGDAFMLIHRSGEGTVGLNGSGRCPAGLSADRFPDGIPGRGPNSASVPSVVRAWHDAHARFGKLPWRHLFRRAIAHASEGFPLSDDVARSIQANRALLQTDAACAQTFLQDGGLAAGGLFRQEALGATLKRIAEEGADAFFEGRVSAAISACIQNRGGVMSSNDFAAVRCEWVEPLVARYRGRTLAVMPPNSYGLLLLLQMKLLERAHIDWKTVTDDERLAALLGAWSRAYAAGRDSIADPSPTTAKVDVDALAERAAQLPETIKSAPNPGGTAVVAVGDRHGNGTVLVQSVFRAWGAAVLDPETGVLLNNRLSAFSVEHGHPNEIAPGKRPAHTLCPAMVLEGGALRFLVGSPGGTGQTITMTQVLTNVLDRQFNLAQAVAAPRWSSDLSGNLITESTIPASVVETLNARGFAVAAGAAGAPYFGSAQLIEVRANGVLAGAADHRREDCLLAR